MSRSLRKGPFVDPRLLEKLARVRRDDNIIIKTWARHSTISPEMVGFKFGVHNGKEFVPVLVSEDMVGHKLGEFSASTKFHRHGGKMQKGLEQQAEAGQAVKIAAVDPKKPAAK